MPTILKIKSFRFYFFSNEGEEPIHIHIEKGNSNGKVWLEPEIKTAYFYNFTNKEIKDISKIISENLETMNYPEAEPRGIKWNYIFPTQRVGELNHFLIKNKVE